jgi:hypothetical protein
LPAVIVASFAFAPDAGAQTTNPPATTIENLQLRSDTVIVKGFTTVGTVPVGDAVITVRSKESSDIGQSQKAYGIAVGFGKSGEPGRPENFPPKISLAVDYDELDPLAGAIDYLGKITYDVTPLAGFDASFATKSGLRFSAHSAHRQGGIQAFIQFGDAPKIPLALEQLAQLRNLITQAKTSLDAIK